MLVCSNYHFLTVSCGVQPTVSYTSVELSKSGDVVTATYSCLSGYSLATGSMATKTCASQATSWSADVVECEIKGNFHSTNHYLRTNIVILLQVSRFL